MDIIKITKLEGFSITNLVDKGTFNNQSMIVVYFRNGGKRFIDLLANTDITSKVESHYLKLNVNNDIIKQEQVLWEEE